MLRYIVPKNQVADSLTEEEYDLLWEIADRYNTSYPISGDWRTEAKHEMNAIAKELNLSKVDAKNLMIQELGFTSDMF